MIHAAATAHRVFIQHAQSGNGLARIQHLALCARNCLHKLTRWSARQCRSSAVSGSGSRARTARGWLAHYAAITAIVCPFLTFHAVKEDLRMAYHLKPSRRAAAPSSRTFPETPESTQPRDDARLLCRHDGPGRAQPRRRVDSSVVMSFVAGPRRSAASRMVTIRLLRQSIVLLLLTGAHMLIRATLSIQRGLSLVAWSSLRLAPPVCASPRRLCGRLRHKRLVAQLPVRRRRPFSYLANP